MNNTHHECDEWTKSDIQSLKVDAFDEIFEKVRDLSGVNIKGDEAKEIEKFPEDG